MDFGIDYSLFNLKKKYFDFDSSLHGIGHTYRVMCLILYLGQAIRFKREVEISFCAAYVHDLARKHDGYCDQHGLWAVQYKLPEFLTLFKKIGISPQEIDMIKKAVTNHSELKELPLHDEAYKISAILKDADALDRIRLGDNNLDPKFLRFSQSFELINFAKELFMRTHNIKFSSFTEVLKIAELINQKIK